MKPELLALHSLQNINYSLSKYRNLLYLVFKEVVNQMDFNHFRNLLPKIVKQPLGGQNSQFKLAPKERVKPSLQFISEINPKKAAVLALFYPNNENETCFLLTLRASYKGTHSAQISFPGGKFDKKDTSLKQTALRESNEEIGINAHSVLIFKQLTNVFIPPSNFMVTPFLGLLENTPYFTVNHEVEALIPVKLAHLLNSSSVSTTILNTSYAKNIEVPCFKLNNYVVWGATAMMLSEIRDLLKQF